MEGAYVERLFSLSTKIIVGGRLIDGKGGEPIDDSVVVVEGKMIKGAGGRGGIGTPTGAEVIDAPGDIVIQGLLAMGVTTVRIPPPVISSAYEIRVELFVAIMHAFQPGLFPAPRVVA